MSLALYVDVHVPSASTAGLRRCGVDVLTSQEDGTERWSDDRLLERATGLGRALFSQDDDMLRIASQSQQQGRASAGVIYAHQLSAGIGTLVQDLGLVLSCCDAAELANGVMYLPLK